MTDNFPLLFIGFFYAVKKELGYSISIEKYNEFVTAFAAGQVPVYDYDQFSRFCRILFLQNERDRAKFQKLLDKLVKAELDNVVKAMDASEQPEQQKEQSPFKPGTTTIGNTGNAGVNPQTNIQQEGDGTDQHKKEQGKQILTRWFDINTVAGFSEQSQEVSPKAINRSPNANIFIHSDEYLPITRRQMIKTWHFLRREEKKGYSSILDVPQTVNRIARDGIFINPVFQKGVTNREKTLVIFADVKGSMIPFSAITNRLIHTALNDGGLKDSAVYYFQNYPLKYVYQTPQLLHPLSIFTAMNRANRNFTIAVIISDAGAARGNYVPERVEAMVGGGNAPGFLELLRQSFAHVVWLNPLPGHRWAGSSAEPVAAAPGIAMYSIFEKENFDFQHIVRAVMGGRNTLTSM